MDSNIIKDLTKYSRMLINKNYYSYNYRGNVKITPLELVSEAYSIGFNNYDDAVKIIRNYFLMEILISKGKRQRGSISADYEKKCNKCKKTKHNSEYKHLYNEKIDLHYLYHTFKECRRDLQNSKEEKEKRRKRYKDNPEYARKAKLRYLKFKNKKKL